MENQPIHRLKISGVNRDDSKIECPLNQILLVHEIRQFATNGIQTEFVGFHSLILL